MTPTEIALAAVTAIFTSFDPEAATELLDPGYIQHNPAVPTGAAPIIGFIPALEASGLSLTTHRVIAEEDLVVLHNTFDNAQAFGAETIVTFDIFRIENGKVAEHWDNIQPLAPANASGRTMTDGPTEVVDLDKTAENKALVSAFVGDVLHGKAPQKITDYISPEVYYQHNPMIGDGLENLGKLFASLAEAGTPIVYTASPLIVAEGNFVFVGSEGTFGDDPMAFFDLFRVEAGKIVEHWDVVSPIPSEWAHDNGKF